MGLLLAPLICNPQTATVTKEVEKFYVAFDKNVLKYGQLHQLCLICQHTRKVNDVKRYPPIDKPESSIVGPTTQTA